MADGDYSWVGPLIQGAGSAIGQANAQHLTDEDRARMKALLAKLGGLQTPNLNSNPLDAEAGRVDPELRASQMRALSKLKSIQDSGGLTLEDQAAQNKALNRSDRSASAGQARILESLAARGQGSSGNVLAAQLANQQGAAERANETGMTTAGAAQRRYLESILAQGKMSGEMQDRDFRARTARDSIAQYNRKMLNGNSQQNFNDELSKITGQQPGTNSLVDFDQVAAQRMRNQGATLGAAGDAAWTDATRNKGSGGTTYSDPPLVNADTSTGNPDDWEDPYKTGGA